MPHANDKTTKRKYKIIERPNNGYRVKVRFLFGYRYIRKGFKPLEFTSFKDVVMFILEKKKEDNIRGH